MSSEREDAFIKRIVNLLAVATIYAETPTFTDRMANSLSKASVVSSIYDAERMVEVGKNRQEIIETVEKTKNKKGQEIERPVIIIKGKAKVYGRLPSENDISRFLDQVERDIYLARKVGALAMSIVNKAG